MKLQFTDPQNLYRTGLILMGSLAVLCLPSACSTAPEARSSDTVYEVVRHTPTPTPHSKSLARSKSLLKKRAPAAPSVAKSRTPSAGVQSEPGDIQVDAQTRAKMAKATPKPKPKPAPVQSEVPNASDVR